MIMNTTEILIKAKSLIENPKNWNRNGQYTSRSWFGFGAQKYCAWGAIQVTEGKLYSDAQYFLYNAFTDMKKEGLIPDSVSFTNFNDKVATHEEILAVFDRAIKNAREA